MVKQKVIARELFIYDMELLPLHALVTTFFPVLQNIQ